MANYRAYKQGQSIDLFVKLTVPNSLNQPGQASRVFLRALVRTDALPVTMPSVVDFAPSGNIGEFFLRLDSAHLIPGTYQWQVAALASDGGVALAEDFFVVEASLTP